MTKPRTLTIPIEKRAALLEGPDSITALREMGSSVEHVLLEKKEFFLLGSSPGCDVIIPGPYVSSLHCVLERRGRRIRVNDQSTKNGTTFAGKAEEQFDIGPGDVFTVATTPVYALSEDMRVARQTLATVLGFDADAAVDEALLAARRGPQLLVVGERGAGQSMLVEAIHQASLRRERSLVTAPSLPSNAKERDQLLTQARRGTLALSLTGELLDAAALDELLSAERNLRVVFLAPSLDVAVRSIGPGTESGLKKIWIRPLRDRTGDLATLLDRLLVERRASLRTTDLTPANQAALHRYAWPENLDELGEAARFIAAFAAHGSLRKTATALATPRSTLQYWIERIGLELPLTT